MRLTTRVTDHGAFFIEDVCFCTLYTTLSLSEKASETDLISLSMIDRAALHSLVAEQV